MSCFTFTHHLATDCKRLPPDSELFPLLSLLKVASLSRSVGVEGTQGGRREPVLCGWSPEPQRSRLAGTDSVRVWLPGPGFTNMNCEVVTSF